MHDEMILGTECMVKISLPTTSSGVTPWEYDFEVELYTNPKKRIVIKKFGCFPIENEPNAVLVPFDSGKVGVGEMNVEVAAYIPDIHFEDGLRTERFRIESITTIIP